MEWNIKNLGKLVVVAAIAFIAFTLIYALFERPAEGQTTAQRLLFTWPGDDGNVGTCAGLDLRWRTVPIVGTDTLSWWNAATKFTGTYPVPKIAGTADSLFVTGLPNGVLVYAVVEAFDEAANYSGFSNVASFTTRDFIPPSAIRDLRVGMLADPFTVALADATELDRTRPAAVRDLTPPGAPRGAPGASRLTT